MKQLVRNTSLMGGTEVIVIFVMLLRNKYLAYSIGPEGFGVFNLIQSFFNVANVVAGNWLATATLKYIAEYNSRQEQQEVNIIFNLSFFLTTIVAGVLAVLFIVFFNPIKSLFLSPDVLFSYFALFTASFVARILVNLIKNTLHGLMAFGKIVRVRIVSQIFNLLSVVLLVYVFDLLGFFINVALVSIFTLVLYFYYLKGQIKVKFTIPDFRSDKAKKIFNFSGVDIILGGVSSLSQFLTRKFVLDFISMQSLGLFAASQYIQQYMAVFTNAAMFYFKPKMSSDLVLKDRNKLINDYFRLVITGGLVLSLFTVLFGALILNILFSKSFVDLSSVLYIFVLAQFIRSIQFGYMFTNVGMAKLKIHAITTVVAAVVGISITFFMINRLGLLAAGIGSCTASLIHILISAIYLKNKEGVKMSGRVLILFMYSVFILILGGYSESFSFLTRFLFLFVFSIPVITLTKKHERLFVFNFIKSKLKKRE